MHIALSGVAAFPEYAQQSTGGPRFPAYPVIDQSPTAQGNTGTGYAPLVLGQSVIDRYGFEYLFVRAQAALAKGQSVSLGANPAEAAISAPDTIADNIHVIKTNFAGLLANAEVGNFVHFGNSTGSLGDLKLILANTATSGGVAYITISAKQQFMGLGGSYDANAPAAAYAAAGSEVSLIRPYQVSVCGLSGECFGIAMGTVTSGNDTLVQITGLASCLGVAATAFTDNALVYTKAAGEVSVTAGLIAGVGIVGLSKSAYAGANAATVPVWLMNVKSKW